MKQLYELESNTGTIVKMSKLDDIPIHPKPIESQKVTTCLKVFSDTTYTALLNHTGMANVDGVHDTATFIKKVISWWKIVNVKALGADIRHNDDLEGVIKNPLDPRLDFLLEFGDMCLKMMASKQGHRINCVKDLEVPILSLYSRSLKNYI